MTAQQLALDRNVCPFMHRHYEECYCNSFDSQDTEKIISFCGGSYRHCNVYQAKFISEPVMNTVECVKNIF